MKAITLHQPWAQLVAIGAKKYETRTFAPPAKLIGQRIAIGAAARKIGKSDWGKRFPAAAWAPAIDALQPVYGDFDWNDLPRGAVVCTAVIAGAYRIGDGHQVVERRTVSTDHLGPQFVTIATDHFGDYSPGRWAWLLTDVVRLGEPVPAKGKQGWWEWEAPANG